LYYELMLKPLQDFVLINVEEPVTKKGAIEVIEEWKSLPPVGIVEVVGPNVTSVKEGDRVQFERYSSIILEGNYRMAKESSIYGVIDETA
jgi:co-chaperonin GroES (HSP10)